MDIKKLFNRRTMENQVRDIVRNYVAPTATNVLPVEDNCIQDSIIEETSVENKLAKEKKLKTNRKKGTRKNKKEI